MEGESQTAMAQRHVLEGQARIEKQRAVISRLAAVSLPTEEAWHLLKLFEANQEDHQRHLNQIVEQQCSGEVDEGRNLRQSQAPLI